MLEVELGPKGVPRERVGWVDIRSGELWRSGANDMRVLDWHGVLFSRRKWRGPLGYLEDMCSMKVSVKVRQCHDVEPIAGPGIDGESLAKTNINFQWEVGSGESAGATPFAEKEGVDNSD